MKKMLFMMACVLSVGLAFQSCKSSDQKILDNVQKAIATDYRTISASVNDGVVTLTGTVDNQQTRSAAESAVRNVKNVKSVMNNIMVSSTNQNMQQNSMMNNAMSDDAMRTALMSSLNAAGFRTVNVMVNNGEVTLSGELNRSDLQRVMQMANEMNPRRVINNITLK